MSVRTLMVTTFLLVLLTTVAAGDELTQCSDSACNEAECAKMYRPAGTGCSVLDTPLYGPKCYLCELDCIDGINNDRDEKTDCNDEDCDRQPCIGESNECGYGWCPPNERPIWRCISLKCVTDHCDYDPSCESLGECEGTVASCGTYPDCVDCNSLGTGCGDGGCSSDEKPSWSCVSNACQASCQSAPECEVPECAEDSDCAGSTACGYGNCEQDEKPAWRCVGGSCIVNCAYDASCGVPGCYTNSNCAGSTACGYGNCEQDEKPAWRCNQGQCGYDCGYAGECACPDYDKDGVCDEDDCEPQNMNVYPGAVEVCHNDKDDDCDGDVDERCGETSPGENRAPQITQVNSPLGGDLFKPGEQVEFDVIATDADGDSLAYSWIFGDGSTSNEEKPVHPYVNEGIYTAKVTVSDNKGGMDSYSVVVNIMEEPVETSAPAYQNVTTFVTENIDLTPLIWFLFLVLFAAIVGIPIYRHYRRPVELKYKERHLRDLMKRLKYDYFKRRIPEDKFRKQMMEYQQQLKDVQDEFSGKPSKK
jgi:hypothetical protein